MKIGFTGTRKSYSGIQKIELLKYFSIFSKSKKIEFHHGCCIGSDEKFHRLMRQIFPNCKIIGHPPLNKSLMAVGLDYDELYEPADYLVRDRQIVDVCQMLIATPEGEEVLRSGTWATIRYALKQRDKSVLIFR